MYSWVQLGGGGERDGGEAESGKDERRGAFQEIERKAPGREIFRARQYNHAVGRYILLPAPGVPYGRRELATGRCDR